MNRRHLLAAVAATLAFTAAAPSAFADEPVYTKRFSNVAVGGADAVAFFNQNAKVDGSEEFSTEYNGAVWRFSSQENLDMFVADPAAFAPQYGGYCAWAMAQGKMAPGNPKFWKVVDNKLYLNFNGDIQEKWEADIPGFITKADAQWPSVSGISASSGS